jgi:hypothetical protein
MRVCHNVSLQQLLNTRNTHQNIQVIPLMKGDSLTTSEQSQKFFNTLQPQQTQKKMNEWNVNTYEPWDHNHD